jgi:hypothetical protein
MTARITREMALSICETIREENRARPSGPQALRCQNCEACSGGTVIKSQRGDRPCCLVRQRYARLIAMPV